MLHRALVYRMGRVWKLRWLQGELISLNSMLVRRSSNSRSFWDALFTERSLPMLVYRFAQNVTGTSLTLRFHPSLSAAVSDSLLSLSELSSEQQLSRATDSPPRAQALIQILIRPWPIVVLKRTPCFGLLYSACTRLFFLKQNFRLFHVHVHGRTVHGKQILAFHYIK